MKKSDLKAGYLVRYRNEDLRMVIPVETRHRFAFVGEYGDWMGYEDYDESLICNRCKEFDIVEVYGLSEYIPSALTTKTDTRKLLWQRNNKKEMTISEIEKELGYTIKIVKD